MKLDIIDWKILRELDVNARKPLSSMAKKLRCDKGVIQYRLKRLLNGGVIKKFVTQVSLAELGIFAGKIYFRLAGYSQEELDGIHKSLIADQQVVWIAKGEGTWDLMIGTYIKSIEEFVKFKKRMLSEFSKFITDYVVLFIENGHSSQRVYLPEDHKKTPKKVKEYIGEKKTEVDEKDLTILRRIANDARASHLEISKNLGMNVKTVTSRIKRLEKEGVIQGYVTFIDPKKLSLQFYKICISTKVEEKKVNSLVNYCLEQREALHIIESLGPWEVEVELEVKSTEDLYRFNHDLRNKFPDLITRIDTILIPEELKLDFIPSWI